MRLIDADVLKKRFKEEIKDMVAEEDKTCFLYATELIDSVQTEKAIPIEWLHKELIDLMYDGKAKEDALHVFHRLIGKWEKQNESHISD